MEVFSDHPQWSKVEGILATLRVRGFQALLAGGCVRDGLLGIPPKDFDVVTNAVPTEVEAVFPNSVSVGKQFGVIILPFGDFQVEVATFRSDGSYQDGRRPETVVFTNPEADAARRDFTINAMFYDVVKSEVLDFVGGRRDLLQKTIRAVGDPVRRFEEDKLRMIRAVRFVSQLEFHIESSTWRALQEKSHELRVVSQERLRDELDKLLRGRGALKALSLLKKSGLLMAFPSSIQKMVVKPSLEFKKLTELRNRIEDSKEIAKLELMSKQLLWSSFLSEEEGVAETLETLRFSKADIKNVHGILSLQKHLYKFNRLTHAEKRQAVASHGFVEALTFLKLTDHSLVRELECFYQKYPTLPQAYLKGSDLCGDSMGLKGAVIGQILKEAYDLQLNAELNSREEALSWLAHRSKDFMSDT